jgi:murein DD-endopeptidase MepM/ murein hydrolase activator NlpD
MTETLYHTLKALDRVARIAGSAAFFACATPYETPLEDSAEDTAAGSPMTLRPLGLERSTSAAGWTSPLATVPSYSCKYATSGGSRYTTLWADNEDAGATVKASSKYKGSLCDTYDDISGVAYNGEFCGSHPGVDIAVASGTTVYAIGAGSVYAADSVGATGWGKYVVLQISARDASGAVVLIYVTYAHLSAIDPMVTAGRTVSSAQKLGATGNTGSSSGPHLHFQIDTSSASKHPYWPSGAPNGVDWTGSLATYTYNPLTALGFGSCY